MSAERDQLAADKAALREELRATRDSRDQIQVADDPPPPIPTLKHTRTYTHSHPPRRRAARAAFPRPKILRLKPTGGPGGGRGQIAHDKLSAQAGAAEEACGRLTVQLRTAEAQRASCCKFGEQAAPPPPAPPVGFRRRIFGCPRTLSLLLQRRARPCCGNASRPTG